MDYDDYQVATAPPWLSDANGTLWNRVLGTVKQAIIEGAKAAVKARFADAAPLDALPHLLEDRGLDPPWRETGNAIRSRIKRAWDTHMMSGTKLGMIQALKDVGYENVEVLERPQDPTLAWWQFEVRLSPPFPWRDDYLADGRWNDPGVWDDGGLWAGDVPVPDLDRMRLIVSKKPTHAECRGVVVVHAGETWDADAPPGTWDDDATAMWGDDVSVIQL